MDIKVEKNLSEQELQERGVFSWGIWENEESEFPWTYGSEEVCYLLEGEVEVTPDDGDTVKIKAGDFVTFASGLSCTWKISVPVKKHFSFN